MKKSPCTSKKIFLPKNQGGQESAPFELLVAVVIMSFVIFVGLIAIERVNREQCFAKIEQGMEKFKIALEIAVTQKSPQQIYFKLSDCFDPEKERVWVQDYDDPRFCADQCQITQITCTTLEYFLNQDGRYESRRKCLNISPETVFPSELARGRCQDTVALQQQFQQEFILQDFKNNAPQGSYLLINKTYATDTSPTICSYQRV